MKQVAYCADCGSAFDSEMGFCPKCDYEGDIGEEGIPPLADLWDMSMEQLGEIAENNNIRGWRRLEQKGLIYQLNQLRLTQVETFTVKSLYEEFAQFAQERNVEAAKKKYEEICEATEEVDEQIVMTMDWVLLPEQIAAALSEADIPELAFQIDDPEIHQAANDMIQMFAFRSEVEQQLVGLETVSDIPEHLLSHADHVVNGLAQAKRSELKSIAREKAQGKMRARRMGQERKKGIYDLTEVLNLADFPSELLEHEDDELRQQAQKRLSELERKEELLVIIKAVDDADDIPNEALKHDDNEVRRAARRKRRKLLGSEKEDLLHRIRNSLALEDIPAISFGYQDQEVDVAANKRKRFLVQAQATIESIASIYTAEPLNELLEHEHGKVCEAARLRLRVLEEIPEKLRNRSKNARMRSMVDELAAQWAAEAEAAERHQADVMGKADVVGFSLGDDVDVSYIGQSFSGTVQGFTSDGEFVEIMNTETSTVWPIPFNCVTPR